MLRVNGINLDEVEYNKGQLVLQRILRFTSSLAPVMVASVQLSSIESLPALSAPYKQIITAFSVNGCILIGDMARALVTQEDPLSYLRELGDGSVKNGLRKESAIVAGSFLPSMLIATGYGVGLDKICADAYGSGNINTIITCSMLQGPTINVFVVGAPAWAFYDSTKGIIDRCMSAPIKKAKEHPETKLLQDMMYVVMRLGDSLLQSELIRQIVLMFSPSLMHVSCALLLPAVLDQTILAPLNYVAYQPNPIKNLVQSAPILEMDDEYFAERRKDLCKQRGKVVGMAMVATVASLASVAGAYYLMIDHITEERDPENMSEVNRVGYESLFLAGAYFLNEGIKAAPRAIHKISHWIGGFFNAQPIILDEEEHLVGGYMPDQEPQLRV